jgi:outer membrane receptor protein involved in Fe transport
VGSGASFSIRGLNTSISDGGVEQEVSTNIDGTPISRGRIVRAAMFDLQDIEVLKGPQALYFGKNSPAGVVSVTSVNPGQTREGYLKAGIDPEHTNYYAEGAITLPVTGDLSTRFAFRANEMDGSFIKNIAGPITDPTLLPKALAQGGTLVAPFGAPIPLPGASKNEPGDRDLDGRVTVSYKPAGRFSALLKALITEHKDNGDASMVTSTGCGAFPTQRRLDYGTFTYIVDPYGHCGLARINDIGSLPAAYAATFPGSNGGVPYTDVKSQLVNLTLNDEIRDDVTLTSVTSFYHHNAQAFSTFEGSSLAVTAGYSDETFKSWMQELRLQTSFKGPLNATFGGFYEDNDRTYSQNGQVGYIGPNAPGNPATGNPQGGLTNMYSSADFYNSKTYSGFGELNWKIVPNLELAGGARYTEEKKTGNLGMTYLNSRTPNLALAPGVRVIGETTQTNVSPEATLTWKPSTDVMLYGAYKTGFKSGGFSTPAIIPITATAQNQQFGEETAEGGEIGLKFQVLDRRLTGDLTGYRYTYKGLQLTSLDPIHLVYFTQNAGSARVQGVEANLNFQATRALSLRGAFGYNDGEYVSFPKAQCWAGQMVSEGCVGGAQNLSGTPLPRAPKVNASIGASYDTDLVGAWRLGLSVDGRYSSGYITSVQSNPLNLQGDYAILDASVRVYDGPWEFALIGKNLTDTIYISIGGDYPLAPRGQTYGQINPPREIIMQVTRRF